MIASVAESPVKGSPVLAAAPHRIGKVTLVVRDLDRVARFYQDVIGLDMLERSGSTVRLGIGEDVLMELKGDPSVRTRSPRDAGLFHTAFLLPGRRELGAWLAFAAERRVPVQGASDHAVSEAIYLADPEGNGIEIYADRPAIQWPRTADGLAMTTEPLDIENLLQAAGSTRWDGFPAGGTVGHLHLQVGAIAAADAFYSGLLGFDIAARYPGASFFGSGGYHHQLAGNIWNSRNASPRSGTSTGLERFELLTRDPNVIESIAARLDKDGRTYARTAGGLTVDDPWGTTVAIAVTDR